MAFNPYIQTNLASEKAQGANVGDIRDSGNGKFRWDGVNWNPEQSSSSSFSSSSSGSSLNPQDIINKSIEAMKQANQPVVSSLQSSVPEIQQKYQTERTRLEGKAQPLQDRYKNLIDSIKGNQQVAENRQTVTTNNELGRRGIVGSSGLAQQTLTDAVNPITQQYTGMIKDAGIAQETDLKSLQDQITGLVSQETSDLRSIQNAIAQLQSGAITSGNQQGMNLYSTLLGQENSNRQFVESQKTSQLEQALRQAALEQQAKQTAADEAFRNRQLEESIRQFNVQQGNKNGESDVLGAYLRNLNVQGASTTPKPTTKPKVNYPAGFVGPKF